jgi:hypothetical protein
MLITALQILPPFILGAVRAHSLSTELEPEQFVEDDISAASALRQLRDEE